MNRLTHEQLMMLLDIDQGTFNFSRYVTPTQTAAAVGFNLQKMLEAKLIHQKLERSADATVLKKEAMAYTLTARGRDIIKSIMDVIVFRLACNPV